jgi:uncharacterized protein (TIGR03083 family)
MEPAEYVDALADRADALLSASRVDLRAPVPSCPGWEVSDLLTHVGTTWGWAATIVRTGGRADASADVDKPGPDELIPWAEVRITDLIEVLKAADPDANCWTFGLPRTSRFWMRRQANETTVHAWDAQGATGARQPIDPELAADGLDEYLTVMLERLVKRAPDGWDGQSVHLHRTDGPGEWTARLGPDGSTEVTREHRKGDLALRGPAESLYLWCVNRSSLDDLEVFGDRSIAERWTSRLLF